MALSPFGLALGELGKAAQRATERPWLAAALRAANWIASSRVTTPHGVTWPVTPVVSRSTSTDLYYGTPGIVLFYLELYAATGDSAFLREALLGADEVLASVEAEARPQAGLYEGLSGSLFMACELSRLPEGERYAAAAADIVARLGSLARPVGYGVEWNSYTDVIGGTAGIGMALLHVARTLDPPDALSLAQRAGVRLVAQGVPVEGGLRWDKTPGYAHYLPNFSHGTAGVGTFLAALYEQTGGRAFLEAATAGASHILEIANVEDGGFLVMHDHKEGRELYYLGWCHGPVGTTRLFRQLARATGDSVWDTWVVRGASSILASGIPERRTPGFWNNVSVCCGNAGVLQYFVDLSRTYEDGERIVFAKRVAEDLIRRGTHYGTFSWWTQAEHRTSPDHVIAQTGLMQGAAGIGLALLRLDAAERGAQPFVRFPDSPFES